MARIIVENDDGSKQTFEALALGGEKSSDGKHAGGIVIKDIGRLEPSQNRIREALAETYAEATNLCSWEPEDNIREITVIINTINAAGDYRDYARLAFNKETEGAETTALASADSETALANHEEIPLGKRITFRFDEPLLRLAILPVDGSATHTIFRAFVGAK